MIGMAVGIDYSLFYLRREREERRKGRSAHEALLEAARTSGQAVLISGATVLIAMAGMFVSGNSLFSTIGLGTMIVVLAAMIGSLTVLPALLHRLGDRVDFGRIPFFRSARPRRRRRGAASSQRSCAVRSSRCSSPAGVLVVLALPALGMHTKLPNLTDLPHDLKIVRTYERIQQAFPGSQTPARSSSSRRTASTHPRCAAPTSSSAQRARATGELFAPFTVTRQPRPNGGSHRLRRRGKRGQCRVARTRCRHFARR